MEREALSHHPGVGGTFLGSRCAKEESLDLPGSAHPSKGARSVHACTKQAVRPGKQPAQRLRQELTQPPKLGRPCKSAVQERRLPRLGMNLVERDGGEKL